jgi:GT2 family glycosyltransferase
MRCTVPDSDDPTTRRPQRIAVLVASHNRRAKTLTSLSRLRCQELPAGMRIELYLTDDGSTDGTADAVVAMWPDAVIVHADGSLYWACAMALAEQAAMRSNPDYLLWLNDDTDLSPGAILALLETLDGHEAIAVGAVADASGLPLYGGLVRLDHHPQRLRLLPHATKAQVADTFNGNVVLIPISARRRIGPLDGLFPHAYADIDYGLRATEASIEILQVPGVLGTCARNPSTAGLRGGPCTRWRAMQHPKGFPWRAQARFLRRHGRWWWPAQVVAGQVRRVMRGRL